jgi:hypothetical protein
MNKYILTIGVILMFFLFACKNGTNPVLNANQDPAQYGVPFQQVPNTENIVMYEVNIGAFS